VSTAARIAAVSSSGLVGPSQEGHPRPRLGSRARVGRFATDRLVVGRTSAERKCDTALVADKLGVRPHAVGSVDVHRLAGTIDDRLAQLRPLGVGRREIAHILGGEIRIEAGVNTAEHMIWAKPAAWCSRAVPGGGT